MANKEEEEGKKLAMTLRPKIAKSLCILEADVIVFGQILEDAKTLALGMKGMYGQGRRKKCAKLTKKMNSGPRAQLDSSSSGGVFKSFAQSCSPARRAVSLLLLPTYLIEAFPPKVQVRVDLYSR